MKINLAKKNRGVAVIIALIAVVSLTIIAGAFAYSMKVEAVLAANSNHDEQLLWMGRAGIERARWILANEPISGFTSLNQIWAGGPGEGPETNGALSGISLDNFPVGEGTVSIKMIELDGKLNINSADTPLIQQVLTTMGADAGDLSTVADSIQDWVDENDGTRPAGAESDYYQGQSPPYYAKNAPMDDISELLLVKGVTPEMFAGGSDPAKQNSAFPHHKLGLGHRPGESPDYPFGLRDVFTPFSVGKVNLNTASETVLSVLPGMNPQLAQAIMTFRSGQGGEDGSGALRSPNQLKALGVPDQVMAQIGRYTDVKGSIYEVHVTAQIGDYSREYIAIITREGNPHIFGFHWK